MNGVRTGIEENKKWKKRRRERVNEVEMEKTQENREWKMFKIFWESKWVIGFTCTLLVVVDESELVLVLVESVDNSEGILWAVSVFFVQGMNN